MTRYKATISYDGTLFAGFQRQPHARSVQEEIEKTLTRLNQGTPVTVHGAGRTDSGVHALGQVIHFDLPQARDEEKLRFALDTQTPEDIDFIRVEQVEDDFHSRYKKHSKTYEFIVDYGRPKNPMMRHYATHYPYPLDVEKMQAAIQKLEEPMISPVSQLQEPVWKTRFVRLQRLAWSRMQNIIAWSLPFRAMAFSTSKSAIWWELC